MSSKNQRLYEESVEIGNASNGCRFRFINIKLNDWIKMKVLTRLIDLIFFLPVIFSSYVMKLIRRVGLEKLPISKYILLNVGILPIRNHYYEPQFKFNKRQIDGLNDRILSGIDLNHQYQLKLIQRFDDLNLGEELLADRFGSYKSTDNADKLSELYFKFDNGSFGSGDAEIYYNIIRTIKPQRIIEIGSGNSTLVALQAIKKNEIESGIKVDLICIEPYEMKWLEKTDARIIRSIVEDVALVNFETLEENDILFIDSSHVIRPNGDVLFNFLTILPILKKGVYVHIHDIFTPRNYLEIWVVNKCLLWNEQYILEAFLTNNDSFQIICAANYLHRNHYDMFKRVAPFVDKKREPGSFWIQKIR